MVIMSTLISTDILPAMEQVQVELCIDPCASDQHNNPPCMAKQGFIDDASAKDRRPQAGVE